jgi:hypothetical protein
LVLTTPQPTTRAHLAYVGIVGAAVATLMLMFVAANSGVTPLGWSATEHSIHIDAEQTLQPIRSGVEHVTEPAYFPGRPY